MADFWHKFHHDGKSVLVGGGGGARPPPFTLVTTTYKVAVYSPAENRCTTPISSLLRYVLCGVGHSFVYVVRFVFC
jgi:hypothetical protein